MDYTFKNTTGTERTVGQLVEAISQFMHEAPQERYRVTIGSDSQALPGSRADFVTAIVVHRVGHGGRYFWRRVDGATFHGLRDRIIREVVMSLEVATTLLTMLQERQLPEFDFEVHADVGEHGPTKNMIQEVVGMIRAHNFEPKTKPESYAASAVADRHV